MNRALFLILALAVALIMTLCVHAEENVDHGMLTRCEYSETGGMENASRHIVLARVDGIDRVIVDDRDWENGRPIHREIEVPRGALEDLTAYMARFRPEIWADLPRSEIFALDAPDESLTITYADGAQFTAHDGREWPEDVDNPIWLVESFLRSYTVKDARTFEMTFSSFSGGGPEYAPVLSAPEVVEWVDTVRFPEGSDFPGAGYDITFTFRGRVPGRTELTFEMTGGLLPIPLPGQEIKELVYVLEVDYDFNVALVETFER